MSNHYFFLKVSLNDFQTDMSKYTAKKLIEKNNLLLVAGYDDYLSFQDDVAADVLSIQVGSKKLRHAVITWNSKTKELNISLDKFGLKSIYYQVTKDNIYVTDSLYLIETVDNDKAINREAILFYCLAGFLPPRWNFLSSYEQVDKEVRIDLKNGSIEREKTRWNNNFLGSDVVKHEDVTASLLQTLELFKSEIQPNELRLSGGADTRIVSFLWRDRIKATVAHSPWLEHGKDLDVNISKAWAEHLGFCHTVLYKDQINFSFFNSETNKPMLTGLCGGEFLGGQFIREVPSNPQLWLKQYQNLGFVETDDFLSGSWVKACMDSEEFWLSESVRTFLQSTRSTIYKSLYGSWSSPSSLNNTVISPFTESYFLDIFLKIPIAQLNNYAYYRDYFFNLSAEVRRFPLSSQMVYQAPELAPGPEWGIEPKSAQVHAQASAESKKNLENSISRIWEFLSQKKIIISYDFFNMLSKRPETKLNLISLGTWLQLNKFI